MRRPPAWLRWLASFAVAAALLVGLIAFVDHNNGNGLAHESPKAAARLNREAELVVESDQAPHVAHLRVNTTAAVVAAIRRDMLSRIARGDAGAPLQHVRCHGYGSSGTDRGLHCVALAAGVNYPYEAVLDTGTRTVAFCKHDAPPVPSQNIPVSRRCRLPS
jgi:hypothetical protein